MNDVRDVLRKRFHISRVAREVSATSQLALASAAGVTGALHASATTVALLGAGSAGMPQLGEIFDAKGRSSAFQQAAGKISEAESAYIKARAGHLPTVPTTFVTAEGALLLDAINGAIESAEAVQAGLLPSLEQTKKADAIALKNLAAGNMPLRARSDKLVEDGTPEPGRVAHTEPKAHVGATEHAEREPGARKGNTTHSGDDIKADKNALSGWIAAQQQANDFARLRKFAEASKVSTAKDDDLPDALRGLVANAKTKAETSALMERAGLEKTAVPTTQGNPSTQAPTIKPHVGPTLPQ